MNFVSIADPLKSDKLKIMIGFITNEIIKEFFESLVQRYGVQVLNYKFQKINLNCSCGSYTGEISLNLGKSSIDSPEWKQIKKQ